MSFVRDNMAPLMLIGYPAAFLLAADKSKIKIEIPQISMPPLDLGPPKFNRAAEPR